MASASSETGQRKGSAQTPPTTGAARAQPRSLAIPIDSVADAAIAARVGVTLVKCGVCDAHVSGEPGGHGLLIWSRGDEVRYEEPVLCEPCANVLGLSALAQWEREDDDE